MNINTQQSAQLQKTNSIKLDRKIRPLVELFWRFDKQTIASCQEHGNLKPYLAFYESDIHQISQLNNLMAADVSSSQSSMYWAWSITPWLRNNSEIAWNLSPTRPKSWISAYWRPHLDSDLLSLVQIFERHFLLQNSTNEISKLEVFP